MFFFIFAFNFSIFYPLDLNATKPDSIEQHDNTSVHWGLSRTRRWNEFVFSNTDRMSCNLIFRDQRWTVKAAEFKNLTEKDVAASREILIYRLKYRFDALVRKDATLEKSTDWVKVLPPQDFFSFLKRLDQRYSKKSVGLSNPDEINVLAAVLCSIENKNWMPRGSFSMKDVIEKIRSEERLKADQEKQKLEEEKDHHIQVLESELEKSKKIQTELDQELQSILTKQETEIALTNSNSHQMDLKKRCRRLRKKNSELRKEIEKRDKKSAKQGGQSEQKRTASEKIHPASTPREIPTTQVLDTPPDDQEAARYLSRPSKKKKKPKVSSLDLRKKDEEDDRLLDLAIEMAEKEREEILKKQQNKKVSVIIEQAGDAYFSPIFHFNCPEKGGFLDLMKKRGNFLVNSHLTIPISGEPSPKELDFSILFYAECGDKSPASIYYLVQKEDINAFKANCGRICFENAEDFMSLLKAGITVPIRWFDALKTHLNQRDVFAFLVHEQNAVSDIKIDLFTSSEEQIRKDYLRAIQRVSRDTGLQFLLNFQALEVGA